LKIEFLLSSPTSGEFPLFGILFLSLDRQRGGGEILWTICVFTSRMDFFVMKGTLLIELLALNKISC
jgi:hypothetical protein